VSAKIGLRTPTTYEGTTEVTGSTSLSPDQIAPLNSKSIPIRLTAVLTKSIDVPFQLTVIGIKSIGVPLILIARPLILTGVAITLIDVASKLTGIPLISIDVLITLIDRDQIYRNAAFLDRAVDRFDRDDALNYREID
jgi:hypothetical protein